MKKKIARFLGIKLPYFKGKNKIIRFLYPTNKFFSMIDIINYLKENPKIYAINHHLIKFNTVHELE